MRQYAGFSDAEDTNERFRPLLYSGQSGLSVAFDLPTQLGYESDHELAQHEVGLVGVPINSLHDMETLFGGIPLGEVSTSMTINATAPSVAPECIRGTVQNDILKEYAVLGNYCFPSKPSMRLVTDLMAFCAETAPSWNTISISGYHAIERGLAVDSFAPSLSFFFNAHNHLFEEVAKFRAARRMWARIFGP